MLDLFRHMVRQKNTLVEPSQKPVIMHSLAIAFCTGAAAFVPPTVYMPRPVPARSHVQLNFFDDMSRQLQQMMAPPPTLKDAVEMCRDEESSGCTLEMCASSALERWRSNVYSRAQTLSAQA